MKYRVVFRGGVLHADGSGLEVDEFREHLADVMNALIDLGAEDPGVFAEDEHVEIRIVVPAFELSEAIVVGNSLIRAAVHAAGGLTPGWSVSWIEAQGTLDKASETSEREDLVNA